MSYWAPPPGIDQNQNETKYSEMDQVKLLEDSL